MIEYVQQAIAEKGSQRLWRCRQRLGQRLRCGFGLGFGGDGDWRR
jgi:hypothetical protein